jgi:hypothetical protein
MVTMLQRRATRIMFFALVVALAPPGFAVGYTANQPVMPPQTIPVCSHNPDLWHALYDPARNCHYTHEHHDDPNSINDLFGAPGAWYGQPGNEITPPWYAEGANGAPEGHEGYKWAVRRFSPCIDMKSPDPEYQGKVCAVRVLVHVNATAAAATVRFHGFSVEAILEHDGVRGMMRYGGHLDTGYLHLQYEDGDPSQVCPPLPSNPTDFSCADRGRSRRTHSGTHHPAGYTPHNAYLETWYAHHALGGLSPTFDSFGPVDYQNPAQQLFFPDTSNLPFPQNGSRFKLTGVGASTRRPWLMPYMDANRVINFNGYVDRNGEPVSGCTAPAQDCVPLQIENVPWQLYGIPNADAPQLGFNGDSFRMYDTSPYGQCRTAGKSHASCRSLERWITPPN